MNNEETAQEMRRLVGKLRDITLDIGQKLNSGATASVVQADIECAEEVLKALGIMNDRPRLGSIGRKL